MALAAVAKGDLRTVSRETFGDYAERWLEAKRPRLEQSTHRDYETHLRLRLKPAFGALKLRQISRTRIEQYLADLDAKKATGRKVINDSLIPLRQILGRAVREGFLTMNPAISIKDDEPLELPYEAPAMRTLDRTQAPAYLAACADWYRPIAEVLIGGGLRIGETLALEWRDVQWDASAIRVERTLKVGGIGTPKGDRGRTVQLDPFVVKVLRDHRAATNRVAGLIFPVDDRQLPRAQQRPQPWPRVRA